MPPPEPDRPASLGEPALTILEALAAGASTADELAARAGLEASAVAATLAELELAGLVEARAGMLRAWNGRR